MRRKGGHTMWHWGALTLSASAGAAEPAWAVVVGSNQPGPGQERLQYAIDDARRVAAVLVELGGYPEEQVEVLEDPTPEEVVASLEALAAELAQARERGERPVATFYYSGHARSRTLDLGSGALPLTELRRRLEDLDASLTLVILDACQAGAPASTKGVEAAPDFSSHSVDGLHTEGIAVLASSTADELSQESDLLQGSTFTSHLVGGLRGAADVAGDGAVTLAEAYTYAYHRTLVTTAQTSVGSQHPTLETELTGHGDTVITRPALASAQLLFPANLEAEVLLERADSGIVVAEVHKAADSTLRIALVPGTYSAVVRDLDGGIERCDLTVAAGTETTFAPTECRAVVAANVEPKGTDGVREARRILEVGVGLLYERPSDYTTRLGDFGYREGLELFEQATPTLTVAGAYTPLRHLSLVLLYGSLDTRSFSRQNTDGYGEVTDIVYGWSSHRIGLYPRLRLPVAQDALVLYAQGGGGPAWSRAVYDEVPEARVSGHLAAAVGLQWMPRLGTYRGFGLYGQVEATWAPTLTNLLDEVHDAGGAAWSLGLRLGI